VKRVLLLNIFLFLIGCLTAQSLRGEDTIKVLIHEHYSYPLPSDGAEKIGQLEGEILIGDRFYRGFVEVRRDEKGLHFIQVLPFEEYIEGVIVAETGEDWDMEALKAQAVIARTYARYHKARLANKHYDITSSVLHQVYKGDNTDAIIHKAVEETEDEILTYNGELIETFYHSTCTGKTELPQSVWGKSYPYLQSVPCRGEHSPYEQWQRKFSFEEIEQSLGIQGLKEINIASYTPTGRVEMLMMLTEDAEVKVRAVDLRKTLGYRELPSTHFTIIVEGDDIIFEGGGYGHGVGLSQWGALELAQEGKTYREILDHYYPGTILQKQ
jgi:stage II sporulation protein D